MGELRRPLLIAALVLLAVVMLLEVGSRVGLDAGHTATRGSEVLALPGLADLLDSAGVDPDDVDADEIQATADANPTPPGLAISYLALVDGLLFFTVLLMALPLVLPERMTGRIQGVATLVVTIVVVILGIVLAILALLKLVLMVTLFLSAPFGTIAYFAIFGFFPTGAALTIVSLIMALKIAFCIVLFLAQQAFVRNKGLVLLILTSLVVTIVVTFLHGIVPSVLVSITDAIAAIVVAIVAIVWAIVMLVFAIVSIVKVLRVARAQ